MPNVSTRDYLKAEERRFGEMYLIARLRYDIPFNQRPWSWGEKEIERLWTDFIETLLGCFDSTSTPIKYKERPAALNNPHFFGAFIFLDLGEESKVEIFDGQQRITAITMLIASLKDAVREVIDVATSETKTKALQVHTALNSWLQAEPSDPPVLRIVPDPYFNSLFDALIAFEGGEPARRLHIDSLGVLPDDKDRCRLRDGFYKLKEYIGRELSGLNDEDKLSFISACEKTLSARFLCISTTLYKEAFAYQVFRSLNDTGLKLTPADNIKNSLFDLAAPGDHVAIATAWRDTINETPNHDIGEFLRRKYIGEVGACKKDQLHSRVNAQWILAAGQRGVPALVNDWKADAKRVNQLVSACCSVSKANEYLDVVFKKLSISLAIIPLLPAYKQWGTSNPTTFLDICKAIVNFCFRELTIGVQKTSWLEEKLGQAGKRIHEGNSPDDVKEFLISLSPSERFESKFKGLFG